MKLPNAEAAVIPEAKIKDYLLSPVHVVGRHKAVFFKALGYRHDEWRILERDLRAFAARDVSLRTPTDYGQKYEIRGAIRGPNGSAARIVTAWIVRTGEPFPRFLTAYPED